MTTAPGAMQHWMRVPVTPGSSGQVAKLDLVFAKRSFLHKRLRTHGLRGWQAATTAALLAAWDLAVPRTFFDVGANIGVYSLLHQHRWPGETSVAFEPTPALLAASRTMARANGLDVRFEPVAVSSRPGQAMLYLSTRSDASNSLEAGFRTAKETLTVPTITLDGYVGQTGLTPGVVKVDVESHEGAVIAGAPEVLTRDRPILVMELLADKAGQPSEDSARVLRTLGEHGYDSRHLVPPQELDLPFERKSLRDWLFWPDRIPAEFDDLFASWSATVARCMPQIT